MIDTHYDLIYLKIYLSRESLKLEDGSKTSCQWGSRLQVVLVYRPIQTFPSDQRAVLSLIGLLLEIDVSTLRNGFGRRL